MVGTSTQPLRDSALLALHGELLAELDRTSDRRRAEHLRARIAAVERAVQRLDRKLRRRRDRRTAALRALDEQLAAEIRSAVDPARIEHLRKGRSIARARRRRCRIGRFPTS